MFKLQGKDIQKYLTSVNLKLVRTYKGEIGRTQAGVVSAFPTSFITVGFDVVFVAPRDEAKQIEQICLSNDIVEMIFDYNGVDLKGKFSCTTNECTELMDKGERHMQVSLSVVSDGTAITDKNGNSFTVKAGSTVVLQNCSFGKVYSLPTAYASYKYNGYTLPGKILVLGNVNITQ